MKITVVHENDTRRMSRYSEINGQALGNTGALYLSTSELRAAFGRVPDKLTIEVKEA